MNPAARKCHKKRPLLPHNAQKAQELRREKDILQLCNQIRQIAFDLQVHLSHGHLEKVYENGLAHRLRRNGLRVEQQYPLKVFDEDGTVLGDYYADLFVEGRLIIELKACKALAAEHTAHAGFGIPESVGSEPCSADKFWFSKDRN
jgi:GxxExxY protein